MSHFFSLQKRKRREKDDDAVSLSSLDLKVSPAPVLAYKQRFVPMLWEQCEFGRGKVSFLLSRKLNGIATESL
jgi:hypothetical protein